MTIQYYPLTGVPRVNVGGYGPRTSGGVTKLHDAVDLGAPTGTPVVAMADGTVTYGTDPIGGNVAVLGWLAWKEYREPGYLLPRTA